MEELLAPNILALDIGGTTTRAAQISNGVITRRYEQPTPQPATPANVLAGTLKLMAPLLEGVETVGVACAGAVANGRVTATASQTFPGWTDIPFAEQLSSGLRQKGRGRCVLLNDARAAAWGEYAAGAGRGSHEFLFVTVSTGVGAGLVLGGRLHLAGNGLDAELGFVSVPARWQAGYPVTGLKLLGPLEHEASGTALGERARALGYGSARALCDAAEAGDTKAEAEYQHSAALLAWKIADCAALLGVTRVALGGSVGLRTGYLERVRRTLEQFPERYRPEVVHAELGADAGLIGAALWAMRMAPAAH